MSAEKNLKWLLTKTWYRLIKVLFIGFFVLLTLFVSTINYLGLRSSLNSEEYTQRQCTNKFSEAATFDRDAFLRFTILARSKNRIDLLREKRFSLAFTDYQSTPLKNAYKLIGENKDLNDNIDWTAPIDETLEIKAFCDIKGKNYSNPFYSFIINEALILITMFLFLEGGRRLFYYIVLGKFNPKL